MQRYRWDFTQPAELAGREMSWAPLQRKKPDTVRKGESLAAAPGRSCQNMEEVKGWPAGRACASSGEPPLWTKEEASTHPICFHIPSEFTKMPVHPGRHSLKQGLTV